jgi:hypothetical protein
MEQSMLLKVTQAVNGADRRLQPLAASLMGDCRLVEILL